MQKPKVAIFLVGQPRYLTGKSYNSIKRHLIDVYDCSFYCHYWYDEGNTMCQTDWSRFNIHRPPLTYDNDIENTIKELYNPVAYKYDKPLEKEFIVEKYKNYKASTPLSSYNLYSYYTSMKLGAELYENHKKEPYDFYIKMRYDSVITAFPDLNHLQKQSNTLMVCDHHNDRKAIDNTTHICTDEEPFLSVMKISDYFDLLCDSAIWLNDEEFLYKYCELKNIRVNKLPTRILNTNIPQTYNYDMS
jgi:hypothetical protein